MERIVKVVIGPSGVGDGIGPIDGIWNVGIDYIAYKESDNSIIQNRGEMIRNCYYNELTPLKEALAVSSIAIVSVETIDGRLYLKDILETFVIDEDLSKIAKEYNTPVYYNDEVLGEFTLDRLIDVFEKKIEWVNSYVTLKVKNRSQEDIRNSLKVAHELFSNKLEYDKKIKEFTAEELLELKNGEWLDEDNGEVALSKEEFIDRLEVYSIRTYPDGRYDIYCDDNNMFFCHSVIITGNINTGFEEASI